jgi:protein dithiol:quinone oxidoreductase
MPEKLETPACNSWNFLVSGIAHRYVAQKKPQACSQWHMPPITSFRQGTYLRPNPRTIGQFTINPKRGFPMFLKYFDAMPRRVLALVSLACVALLAFGLYLQHVVGLEPCPMCIVQRYALVLVAVVAGITAMAKSRGLLITGSGLLVLLSGFGAFVAARQSFLQWYPPEIASCGRDFYGMIETFPLKRAIPMIFKGSGDCTKIDWTFLGLSIANWSFLCFVAISLIGLLLITRLARQR